MKLKHWKFALLLSALILPLISCAKTQAPAGSETGEGTPVKQVVVGYGIFKPITYIDDNGEPTGVDIEALKLIDELLPEYEFVYQRSEQQAIFAGLQSGKIDIATTNSFWTQDRADRYLFPKENLGMNIEGLLINRKFTNVKTLEDAAKQKLRLVPMLSGDGNHGILLEFNKRHPDTPVEIPLTDNHDLTLQFTWIAEGRYDFNIGPKQFYEFLVESETGELHHLSKDITFVEFGSVRTWPIFRKDEQELADAYDRAVIKLKEDGTLRRLALEFIGYDTWAYEGDNVY
ncbi:MAG: transporter substrate-binding domain-containing protein [Spirochaetaceae bacterium]|jgi:L-cystine transport system substrate-binding protein|nr:transporter substrate-binding domain-containing protein [Spirochaetaceae bacterium]